jgi:hypothetical protein
LPNCTVIIWSGPEDNISRRVTVRADCSENAQLGIINNMIKARADMEAGTWKE